MIMNFMVSIWKLITKLLATQGALCSLSLACLYDYVLLIFFNYHLKARQPGRIFRPV